MADVFTPTKRSQIMSRIRGADSAIERRLLALLLALGLRPARHVKALPGTPDFVLRRRRIVIFTNGCFWHGHHCPRGHLPAANREFWARKIQGNVRRDRRQRRLLRAQGWKVLTFWSCRPVTDKALLARLKRVGVSPAPRKPRAAPA